jgi:hypothetical protein
MMMAMLTMQDDPNKQVCVCECASARVCGVQVRERSFSLLRGRHGARVTAAAACGLLLQLWAQFGFLCGCQWLPMAVNFKALRMQFCNCQF